MILHEATSGIHQVSTTILGISCYYHDSAAALLKDGRIVAAAQEERFTRKKYDPSYPANAIEYCLSELGEEDPKIDHVVFYEKPLLKFDRLLETYLSSRLVDPLSVLVRAIRFN
jgi:carbamoyltransferase